MRTLVKKLPEIKQEYLVKLRIDRRTVIMVRNAESLKTWMEKYPNAVKVL
jgi:hypothetical protein